MTGVQTCALPISHGANLIGESAKQGKSKDSGQGFSPVLSKMSPAAPIQVMRSMVTVQKSQDDYRMFREQARFVTDLAKIG